jgi:two-component system chemotaxis response regulator CheY
MRILIIDDEFASLKKMEVLLSRWGFCDSAQNGEEATELYTNAIKEGRPYELITVDIELPDTSGLELLKIFTGIENMSDKLKSKRIVVSAHGNPDNVLDAAKFCDGFVTKPIKREVLAQKLKALGFKPRES